MAVVDEALREDEALYEVVAGEIVEKPPMGAYSTWIASLLQNALGPFAQDRRLGRVATELLFLLDPVKNTQRRPDVAFVSYERWPRERRVPRGATWDVVPDLAIEVNSPSNTGDELLAKVREYFEAGVRRVWVVYPEEGFIYLYSSPTQVRIFQRGDELDDEDILPGLRLPLDSLFEDADAPEAP